HILTECQLSIDLDVINNHVLRILIGNATGPLFKLFCVLGRPPVAEIALGVKLAAFIVEAVSQFVPDGAASVTVIRCVIGSSAEQRWLQCSRRKIDVV